MDPSDKLGDKPFDTILGALKEESALLSSYSEDFFKIPEIKSATDAVIASFGMTDNQSISDQNEAWLLYAAASNEIINRALTRSGEGAWERATVSSMIHKAMVYKTVGDAVHYFGELQAAEEFAYQGVSTYGVIDEVIHVALDNYLDSTGLSFEKVKAYLLKGTETEEHARIQKGEEPREDSDDPRDTLPDSLVDIQLAIEEELRNGADLQVILGEVYQMLTERGEDPVPVFKGLGFPTVITLEV